jgi:two-component system chemotaxis sensor kinase CheA
VELDFDGLMRTFRGECEDSLHAMEQALLALESRPEDLEPVQTLFRMAHSLKGNAMSLGFTDLADFTHGLEEVLDRLRSRAMPVTAELVGDLLLSVDVLRELVAGLGSEATGKQDATSDSKTLLEQLRDLAPDSRAAIAAPSETKASPPERAAESAAASAASDGQRTRTLRIDVEILDRLLDLTGEMAVARGRLREILERAGDAEALEIHREADRLHADLQELAMRVRLLPVGPSFARQARTLRDAAAALGKSARLEVSGEAIEVDTKVLEQMNDPLTHLVRNAVAHGIEPAAARAALGKDTCGTVSLRASRETGSIVIEVADDGAGLDRARILDTARRCSLVEGDAASLTDSEVHHLIFAPGFSTAREVTDVSGRGVGLDVVRRNVEGLRGTLSVRSREGEGTTFTVRLPLMLTIIQGFGLEVGGETLVVPLESVVECLDLPAESQGGDGATGLVDVRGEALPFVRLRRHLGLQDREASREQVAVVQHRERRVGLVADRLLGESQTVIKPLGRLFKAVPSVAGSTILGNGRVGLLLDVAAVVDDARRRST